MDAHRRIGVVYAEYKDADSLLMEVFHADDFEGKNELFNEALALSEQLFNEFTASLYYYAQVLKRIKQKFAKLSKTSSHPTVQRYYQRIFGDLLAR